MKILLWGVAPWAKTGYGTLCRNLAKILSLRYEVEIYAFAGLTWGEIEWQGFKVYGNPTPHHHGGLLAAIEKSKPDLVLQAFDLWVAKDMVHTIPVPWIAHTPVDHKPLSPWLVEPLKKAHKIVPMCFWAELRMKEAGLRPQEHIYHGVDTSIFKPMDKSEARRMFGIPEDKFVALIVAANRGSRKNIPNQILAFARFVKERKADALLIVHSYAHFDHLNPEGYPLNIIWHHIANELDLPLDLVLFTPPETYLAGFSDEVMAVLYNCADVLLNATCAEGFGLPIIEAGACRVPSIVTKYSSMIELVGRSHPKEARGWLVDWEERDWAQMLSSYYVVPKTDEIVRALKQAYANHDLVWVGGENAYKFALELDWRNLLPKWVEAIGSER